ncbi:MAG: RHS repeat-associated core domain-containing protein [Lysobacteraceae bacterium]
MRYLQFIALSMAFAVSGLAHAQTARTASEEYDDIIKGTQTITALGPDLFGEAVNLKDGATSFSATDVSIPTNSGLPLSIGRHLGINSRDADGYVNPVADGELFGNWKLDVPVMSGTFDERTGWISGSAASPQSRCSIVAAPPSVRSVFTQWNIFYYSEDYWRGTTVHIPGKGSYPLLGLLSGRTLPSDGKTYRWTTKDNWMVSCIPLKNGAGEGFLVTLPDGTRYSFDWMSSRRAAALKDTHCDNIYLGYEVRGVDMRHLTSEQIENDLLMHRLDGGGSISGGGQASVCNTQIVVNRREYFLHATRVEDRHGNHIAYNYDPANPRRLLSVTSNDGGSISLSYGANGKISTISANERQWQYQYEEGSTYGSKLTAVVLPDNSRWTFNYGELFAILDYNKKIKWPDCEPFLAATTMAAVTIGHPSGANGTFAFQNMVHGVDRTPGGCSVPNPDRPLKVDLTHHLMAYKVASLLSKQISGPGLAAQSWNYSYQPSWSWNPSGYADDCGPPYTNCSSTSTTEVTAPDGSIMRSVFGNDYYRNVGQLQRIDVLSAGNLLQQTTYSYLPTSTGQAFAGRAGWDPFLMNNPFETEQLHPSIATTIVRDGVTSTSEVTLCNGTTYCFDSFARPIVVKAHSSLGYNRIDVTEYHDNLNLWTLGQISRQYNANTGIETSRFEYNAQALPVKTFSFGKLRQILGYWTDGNLNTTTDGNGNTSWIGDYHRGIPRLIGFADGTTQSAAVDGNGWITSVVDETGARTCYSHDPMGRVASVVYPSESQPGVCDGSRWNPVSMSFLPVNQDEHGLPAGHWRASRYEGNKHVNTYYDAMWRPVLEETLDASNIGDTLSQVVKKYDAKGRLNFQSYPTRNVGNYADVTQGMRTFYDALDRVVRVEQDSEHNALATTTEYLAGLQVRVTNPRGQQTTTGFVAYGQPAYDTPAWSVEPESKVTEIQRDIFNRPINLIRRNTANTLRAERKYVYDGHGQLCKTIEPETGATVSGYDAAGNLAWSAAGLSGGDYANPLDCSYVAANASGRVSNRTYDQRNRLKTLLFPDGRGNQVWNYEADGLPKDITTFNDPNNTTPVVNLYQYNRRRLLTQEHSHQPGWYTWGIGYAYDAIGNLASQTYPTGQNIDYAPNALGQATRAGSYATSAQYYPNGALKQFTYGNGIVHTMSQNARQLPSRVTSSGGVLDYEYYYDANANPTHIANALVPGYDPQDRWMTFDGLDRLTDAGSASFGGDHWHRFTYDALDNMKSWKLTGVKDYADYVYDTKNRLTNIRNAAGASVVGLGYDHQGNLQNRNGQTYEFDYGNRLRGVTGKEYYRYDGLGRRVLNWRNTTTTTTTVSQYSQAGQLMYQEETAKPASTHIYLGGSLIATSEHTWGVGIAVKYKHTDALGSPVAVTNEVGAVIERNDYEPYGAIIGKPNYSGIGYTGHVMDAATGLTYMQQRYYDQSIGRFLSVDPVTADSMTGSNFNRYKYASNNPYKYVDPDGRQDACQEAFFQALRGMMRSFSVKTSFGATGGAEIEVGKMTASVKAFSVELIAIEGQLDGGNKVTQSFDGAKLKLEIKDYSTGYDSGGRINVLYDGIEGKAAHQEDRLPSPIGELDVRGVEIEDSEGKLTATSKTSMYRIGGAYGVFKAKAYYDHDAFSGALETATRAFLLRNFYAPGAKPEELSIVCP